MSSEFDVVLTRDSLSDDAPAKTGRTLLVARLADDLAETFSAWTEEQQRTAMQRLSVHINAQPRDSDPGYIRGLVEAYRMLAWEQAPGFVKETHAGG